jgi:hypothetical protein
MSAGKGRLVLQHGYAIVVSYEYSQSRRAGMVEGFVSGQFAWLPRGSFFGDIELVCQGGVTLQLTITMYSETIVTFTGTRRLPEATEDHRLDQRARRIA